MRQILPLIKQAVLFATTTDYWSISGQNGLSSTFGVNVGNVPLPWACTFRNISIYCKDPNRTISITLTFRKNNVDTALAVTLPVGQDYATTTGVDVACNALDFVDYKVTAASGQNITAAFCIEHDGPGNFYAVPGGSATLAPGRGGIAGCLGNGGFESYDSAGPQFYSNSASICSIPGAITHLAVSGDINAAMPAGGSFTAWIKKNGVLQDGTGGTVNTTTTLADATPGTMKTVGTFTLPVSVGDIVDVVYVRNTTTVGPALQLTVGIGFTPTNDGWFMLTGGENTGLPAAGVTSYSWQGGSGGTTTEPLYTVPVGPVGITARGLYVIRGTMTGGLGPGTGQTFTHTVLKGIANPYVAGSPTAVELSIHNNDQIGQIQGLSVAFPAGSSIVIRNVPSAGAGGEVMHWGLAATFPDVTTTGTLIVRKALEGSSDTSTEFPIDVGGGLSPSGLTLVKDEQHTYANVVPGSGYSVGEHPPAGWELVGITVSNGSPRTAISVAVAETVTVTVTNRPLPAEPEPEEDCVVETPSVDCITPATPATDCIEPHTQARALTWSPVLIRPSVTMRLGGDPPPVSPVVGRELTLSPGAYAITGSAAGLLRALAAFMASGAYAVDGKTAALLKAGELILVLDPGSYAIVGVDVSPLAGHALNLEPGSYAVTGNALAPIAERLLSLAAGSYAKTGVVADLVKSGGTTRDFNLDRGTYALTGAVLQPDDVTHYALHAEPGAYALAGVALKTGLEMNARPGSYDVTGKTYVLPVTRVIVGAAGSYGITGKALTPLASRPVNLARGTYAVTGVALGDLPTTNDYTLTFAASPDHASVISYTLRLYASPVVAGPLTTQNIGKPTPDINGDITVDIETFVAGQPAGDYVIRVLATSGSGSTESGNSPVFSLPLV